MLTGNKISFAPNDEKCKLNLEIRDVERNFVKLNSTLYLYKMDGNNNIIDSSLSNEIYLNPNEHLILYSMDKTTKFEFNYK